MQAPLNAKDRHVSVNPGWYDDPESALHMRYWNGADWTDERRPKPPADSATTPATIEHNSDKSFVVTLLLAIFVGFLGVHRFYVGKIGTGILHLLTLGALGVWTLIDTILIILQKFTDSNGQLIKA